MKIKLILIIVVISLITLTFAPIINAGVFKKDFVEFTTEIYGLNSIKQTVELSQKEADEVELLFNSISEQLNAKKSREEAVEIFYEAVDELDKYGLLGSLSVEQAKKLVTHGFHNIKHSNYLKNNQIEDSDVIKNYFCLITGNIEKNTYFNNFISKSCFIMTILCGILSNIFREFGYCMIEDILFELSNYLFLLWWNTLLFSNNNLIPIGHTIGFGIEGYIPKEGPIFEPSKGDVISIGLNGVKNCSGSFWGNLPILPIPLVIYSSYPGIFGFTGIKLRTRDDGCLFIGSALWVKIGKEPLK